MSEKKYTERDKEIVKDALRILKKNDKDLPVTENPKPADNGMKCTCGEMNPNPECPIHRMIR